MGISRDMGGSEVTATDPVSAADPVTAEARLRGIQSVTDAALSRLDDRDLLSELLVRIRVVLRADTAAVLLLDSSSGQLIATAAAGLEEEVTSNPAPWPPRCTPSSPQGWNGCTSPWPGTSRR